MAHQVLGIDFGTSYSSVCVLFHKERIVVRDELGNTNIPSVVCFGEKERVGAGADHFKKKYPKNTIYEIKRVVGCRYDDAVVTRLRKVWPFTIVEGTDHRVQVEFYVNNKRRRFFPEYVISKILRYLVGLAENCTGEKFESVVITVPANFNDTQRQCIRVAARFAGLQVLRILDEPVAAAVAISIQTNIDNSRVLVYDLGGGTFDFTILEVTINDYRVIATDGDPCLGGADFTNALTDIARDKIFRDESIQCHDHPRLEVELRNVCDGIKQELSSVEVSSVEMDLSRYGGSASYMLTITRREFESVIESFIKRTIDIVKDCLMTYNVDISTVSGIALVGGSSYIPMIRTQLKKTFPTLRILDGYDPREVVCRGALEQAISLVDDPEPYEPSNPSSVVTPSSPSVTPSSPSFTPVPTPTPTPTPVPTPVPQSIPSIPSIPSTPSIPKPPSISTASKPAPFSIPPPPSSSTFNRQTSSTLIPTGSIRSIRSSTSSTSTHSIRPKPTIIDSTQDIIVPEILVNPEIVSLPQIQTTTKPTPAPASPVKKTPSFRKVRIHPTTPLDLGIRVQGRKMSVIIPRNTPLPAEITKTYQPNSEHPDVLRCCMYQGNSHWVDDNVKIGIIFARDIPVYDGVRSIVNITFSINEEGVFSAKAKVVGSDNEVKIEMLDSVILSENMINDIIKEGKEEEEAEHKRQVEEFVSMIEMRLVELENEDFDGNYERVEKERDWLYANKDHISLDELQSCLNRLK